MKTELNTEFPNIKIKFDNNRIGFFNGKKTFWADMPKQMTATVWKALNNNEEQQEELKEQAS